MKLTQIFLATIAVAGRNYYFECTTTELNGLPAPLNLCAGGTHAFDWPWAKSSCFNGQFGIMNETELAARGWQPTRRPIRLTVNACQDGTAILERKWASGRPDIMFDYARQGEQNARLSSDAPSINEVLTHSSTRSVSAARQTFYEGVFSDGCNGDNMRGLTVDTNSVNLTLKSTWFATVRADDCCSYCDQQCAPPQGYAEQRCSKDTVYTCVNKGTAQCSRDPSYIEPVIRVQGLSCPRGRLIMAVGGCRQCK